MKNKNFWGNPLVRSKVRSDDVKVPEMLLGYFIGTLVVAVASEIAARLMKMPATTFIISSVIVLVPGHIIHDVLHVPISIQPPGGAKAAQEPACVVRDNNGSCGFL